MKSDAWLGSKATPGITDPHRDMRNDLTTTVSLDQ